MCDSILVEQILLFFAMSLMSKDTLPTALSKANLRMQFSTSCALLVIIVAQLSSIVNAFVVFDHIRFGKK
ncbi:hypothetical protein Y032_0062g3392 [Ancylostoma ceylanicum]|nr:hypothetical protein Y032_0062g3392 [Ancylostoma ceylanicum]